MLCRPLQNSRPRSAAGADPLLTTLRSPGAQEGAGSSVQPGAHGYAARKWLLDWGDGSAPETLRSNASSTTAAPAPPVVTLPAAPGDVRPKITFGDAPYYNDPSKNQVKLTWTNVPDTETGFTIYRAEKTKDN